MGHRPGVAPFITHLWNITMSAQVNVGVSHGSVREITESIYWLTTDLTSGKNLEKWGQNGSFGLRKVWGGGKWSEWLLRRQRPRCPGSDSTLYIRCPPPKLPIQFHPHGGISSAAPSLIYPSIHLSLPQQMEKITGNNATTNSPPAPPPHLVISHSNLTSSEVGPSGGRRSTRITQRMWQAAAFFGAREIPHSADVGFAL